MTTPALVHSPRPRIEHLVTRVQAEFEEMPGMHLTFAQVRRLLGLSPEDCEAVLDRLVCAGTIARDENDRFCRQRG